MFPGHLAPGFYSRPSSGAAGVHAHRAGSEAWAGGLTGAVGAVLWASRGTGGQLSVGLLPDTATTAAYSRRWLRSVLADHKCSTPRRPNNQRHPRPVQGGGRSARAGAGAVPPAHRPGQRPDPGPGAGGPARDHAHPEGGRAAGGHRRGRAEGEADPAEPPRERGEVHPGGGPGRPHRDGGRGTGLRSPSATPGSELHPRIRRPSSRSSARSGARTLASRRARGSG